MTDTGDTSSLRAHEVAIDRTERGSAAGDALSFGKVQSRTATNEAVRLISDMILDGRLKPGDKLPPERELSAAMGVSRPTLREATHALVAMHILERRRGAGTFVASLSLDELMQPLRFVFAVSSINLDEIFETRLLLEPSAASLAAARATTEDIAAMTACLRNAHQRRSDPGELLELDSEFHRLVHEASKNQLLIHVLAEITALAVDSRRVTTAVTALTEQSVDELDAVLGAIVARQPQRAYDAMRTHIDNVRRTAPSQRGMADDALFSPNSRGVSA
jgi:GntR family transcriptional regulator, transcriptional repressor for pyruvate dehydrogenase complex